LEKGTALLYMDEVATSNLMENNMLCQIVEHVEKTQRIWWLSVACKEKTNVNVQSPYRQIRPPPLSPPPG